MPGSVTSVFGEPDDFEAALRPDGVANLVLTGHGQFRARLTQVMLHDLRLSAGDEHLTGPADGPIFDYRTRRSLSMPA